MKHYRINKIEKNKDLAIIELEGIGTIEHPYSKVLDLLTHDVMMTGLKFKWVDKDLNELKTFYDIDKISTFEIARKIAKEYKNIKIIVGYSQEYKLWSVYTSERIQYDKTVKEIMQDYKKYGLDPLLITGMRSLNSKTVEQLNKEEQENPSRCNEIYYNI